MKRNILSLACLAAVLFSCTCNDIIQDNVRNAEKQLASLIEASEANDTIRIPSTFKNRIRPCGRLGEWFLRRHTLVYV